METEDFYYLEDQDKDKFINYIVEACSDKLDCELSTENTILAILASNFEKNLKSFFKKIPEKMTDDELKQLIIGSIAVPEVYRNREYFNNLVVADTNDGFSEYFQNRFTDILYRTVKKNALDYFKSYIHNGLYKDADKIINEQVANYINYEIPELIELFKTDIQSTISYYLTERDPKNFPGWSEEQIIADYKVAYAGKKNAVDFLEDTLYGKNDVIDKVKEHFINLSRERRSNIIDELKEVFYSTSYNDQDIYVGAMKRTDDLVVNKEDVNNFITNCKLEQCAGFDVYSSSKKPEEYYYTCNTLLAFLIRTSLSEDEELPELNGMSASPYVSDIANLLSNLVLPSSADFDIDGYIKDSFDLLYTNTSFSAYDKATWKSKMKQKLDDFYAKYPNEALKQYLINEYTDIINNKRKVLSDEEKGKGTL